MCWFLNKKSPFVRAFVFGTEHMIYALRAKNQCATISLFQQETNQVN